MEKYVREVNKINSDPIFHEYISKEEDERKINNTYKNIGIEEGIAKGEKSNAIKIAKKMLDKKFDLKTITEITGLSKEKIESLK